MRIQSIQNQQMQNRPNFSADLRIKKLPNLLGGVRIDSVTLHLKTDSSVVERVLEILPKTFKDFVGIDGPRVSADGANLRHFISKTGDQVVLDKSLYKEDGEKPIGLILKPADGSEIWLTRDDINFIDETPTPTDKLFDDAAAILDKKAVKPSGALDRKTTTQLPSYGQMIFESEFFRE